MPLQLTKEDVRRLYRAGKHAEILAALEAGQLEEIQGRKPSSAPDSGLGPAVQLTRAQLSELTPAEILRAKEAGQLRDLLQGPAKADPVEIPSPDSGSINQITREQIKAMSPDQILAAREAGQLASLLGQPYTKPEDLHHEQEA